MALNDLFTDFINDSQAPPIHGLLGWLNFHEKWIPFFMTSAATFSWSIIFTAASSSFYAPIKSVPSSDQIFFKFPGQAIKQRNDRINESLER